VYIDASRIASEAITDRPVFAGCIGPFSLAGRLFDVTEIMTAILIDPDPIHILLRKATRFLISYVLAFKEAGANGVVIAEPVAGVLSEEHCTEFSSKYVSEIVAAAQDENFFVVLHNCGDTDTLVGSMHGTGAAGLHFGNRCNIVAALRQLPSDLLVFGNLDPSGVIKSGDHSTVEAATRRLLEATGSFRNHVLSSGCDIPPGVPAENIDAIFQTLAQFNESST
jgi:uroporphyrinogen decarboxylase